MIKGIFLVCLFASFAMHSQSKDDIKQFINTNAVALKTVQKNLVASQISSENQSFKDCIAKQLVAVSLYKSNSQKAVGIAVEVRKECIVLLNKYSKGSTEYFKINSSTFNTAQLSEQSKILDNLSKSDKKALSDFNLQDLSSLNTFNITIQ